MRDVPICPELEGFVPHMAQFKYERDAGTMDVLNMPRREDFVRSIIECHLSPPQIKMWKRDLSPQQQVEEEPLLLLHLNQLWFLSYVPFLSGILLKV
jgi:hypothetical protein